jgi:hypothetical protein
MATPNLSPADREHLAQAWAALADAVRELSGVDPTRAILYVREAAASVRSWSRALRAQPPSDSRSAKSKGGQ